MINDLCGGECSEVVSSEILHNSPKEFKFNTNMIQSYGGIDIKVDDIQIPKPIKSLGEHTISINPYDNLSIDLKVFVNKIK